MGIEGGGLAGHPLAPDLGGARLLDPVLHDKSAFLSELQRAHEKSRVIPVRAPPRRMTAMGAPGAHYILDDDARARPVSRGLPELTAIRLDTRADGGPVDALVLPSDASHRDHAAGARPDVRLGPGGSGGGAAALRYRQATYGAGPGAHQPRALDARAPLVARSDPQRTHQHRPSHQDVTRQPRRAFGGAFPRTNDAASRDIVFPDPTAARYRARRPSSAVRGAGKPQRSRGPDAVGGRRVEHFPRAERVDAHSGTAHSSPWPRPPTPERAEAKRFGDGDGDGDAATAPSRAGRPRGKNVGPGPGPASRRGKPPAAEKRRRYAALRASLTEALTRVKTSIDAEAVDILESAVSAGRAAGTDAAPWIATPLADAEAVLRERARERARAALIAAVTRNTPSETMLADALALGLREDDPAALAMAACVNRARREAAERAARDADGRRGADGEREDGDGDRRTAPSPGASSPSPGTRVLDGELEVVRVVGEGAYGVVMRCRDVASGETRAVKEFKINADDPDVEEVRRTSAREVSVLRALNHPNVVRHLGDFEWKEKLYVVMEYVPRTLLELLDDVDGAGLPKEDVRSYVRQLCVAVAFVHASGYVYRDIKPENMLITEDKTLKLCDFGFARRVEGTKGEVLTDYVATRWYRAPELLLGQPYAAADGAVTRTGYGKPVDMWAIGCLMGELTDGEPLFPGDSDVDQLRLLQACLGRLTPGQMMAFSVNPHNAGVSFEGLPDEPEGLARRYEGKMNEVELDFMGRLLEMNPKARMTGEECCRHPYVADAPRSR